MRALGFPEPARHLREAEPFPVSNLFGLGSRHPRMIPVKICSDSEPDLPHDFQGSHTASTVVADDAWRAGGRLAWRPNGNDSPFRAQRGLSLHDRIRQVRTSW